MHFEPNDFILKLSIGVGRSLLNVLLLYLVDLYLKLLDCILGADFLGCDLLGEILDLLFLLLARRILLLNHRP